MPIKRQAATPRVLLLPVDGDPNKYKGPFRPIWCADHHFPGPWPCGCKPGPQWTAWTTEADEIALGGSRGSSKTFLLLGWMAFRGNPAKIREAQNGGKMVEGADVMYINHRNYRGLIMRDQSNDLGDLIDRAEEMYVPTGAKITRGNPATAEWPTGAKIIFGHFGDDGWKKYIGPEYQRIAIDQAEQMRSLELYKRICGSCRSKWSEMKPQTLLTFNPGGGDEMAGAPGQAWLMRYFLIDDYASGKYVRGTIIRDEYKKTRTFIQSKYTDNPYLLHYVEHDAEGNVTVYKPNEGPYVKWLNGIEPESLRRAWRDCDWSALSGSYFADFRISWRGEQSLEPPNAVHVYDPEKVPLEPYWKRWIGVDWGYIHPSAILWGVKSPWGQVYIYREVGLRRVEPVELGVMIARLSKDDLKGVESHHMNVFLSPDAYAKRESENTVASQIVQGMRQELGPKSAFLADLTDEEREMPSDQALESMKRRRRDQAETQLSVLRASTDRVAGWMHIQTMLRFRTLHPVSQIDKAYAEKLEVERGIVSRLEYESQPEFAAAKEPLPKLQISRDCRNLIQTIPMMMYKPGSNDVEKLDSTETRAGDDHCDALRYLCFSEERQGDALAPLETRIALRVRVQEQRSGVLSAHDRIMVSNAARFRELHLPKKNVAVYGHNRNEVARQLRSGRILR